MELKDISKRALEIKTRYAELNVQKYGRDWTTEEVAQGFVGDVGDLTKLVMAKSNIRDIADVDTKLAHELSDCLWSVLILANEYNIDIEKSFLETMDLLEKKLV
jgi:NTP pyrophosphatase (non-canonical NTP hydrolase)